MDASNSKPRKDGGRPKKYSFPWDTIEIGKSFSAGEYSRKHMLSIASEARRQGIKRGVSFSCRKDEATNALLVFCEDPRNTCPHCNGKFDYISLTGRKTPKYRDVTACSICGGKIEYDKQVRPIKMTFERAQQMGPDIVEEMDRTTRLIKALNSLE